MRIRGYDEETEELSSDLENISGDIYDLTKVNGTGVSIFTDKTRTEYKSTYEILKEISAIWDELTDKKQADLLEKLGGKRGAQSLAGILADFSSVEEAMKTMQDAAGSSDKEMGIIRDSIEYKINELKETWVGFLQTAAPKESIKGFIDFGVAMSEWITKFISEVGTLKTVLISIGTIITSKKLKFFNWGSDGASSPILDKLINGASTFIEGRQSSNVSFLNDLETAQQANGGVLDTKLVDQIGAKWGKVSQNVRAYAYDVASGNEQLKKGQSLLDGFRAKSAIFTNLGNSIKKVIGTVVNGLLNFGLNLLITTVGSKVIELISTLFEDNTQKLIDAGKEASDKIDEIISNHKDHKKSVDELGKSYAELAQDVKDLGLTTQSQGALSTDKYQEFLDISNQLAEVFPSLKVGIDDEGNALLNLNGSAQTITSTLKELLQYENDLASMEIQKSMPDVWAGYGANVSNISDEYNEASKNLQSSIESYNKLKEYYGTDTTYGQLAGYVMPYDELAALFEGQGLDLAYYLDKQINPFEIEQIFNNAIKEYQTQVDNYGKQIQSENKKIATYVTSMLSSDYVYQELSNSSKNLVDTVIRNMHFDSEFYDKRDGTDWDVVYTEIKDRTLQVMAKLEADKPELADRFSQAYSEIFNYSQSDKTAKEILEQYQFIQDTINELKISDDDKKLFLSAIPEDKELKDKIDHAKTIMWSNWDDEFLNEFTSKDLNFIANIELDRGQVAYTKEQLDEMLNPVVLETTVKSSDAVNSMAELKDAAGSLSDLWEQVVNNRLKMGKDKKYLTENGTVDKQGDVGLANMMADPALLNSVESAFDKFKSSLDEEGQKTLSHALEEFEDTLVSFPGDAYKAQEAIDNLMTAYIDQTDAVTNLTEENKEWSIAQLKAMGITNAEEVVLSRLNQQNKQLLSGMSKLSDVFRKNGDAIKSGIESAEGYKEGIEDIKTTLEEMFSVKDESGNELMPNFDESFIIDNLHLIEQAAEGDTDALNDLRRAAADRIVFTIDIEGVNENELNGIRNLINDWIDGVDFDKLEIGAEFNNKPMIEGLNGLVRAGKITQESMNKILAGIGVTPQIKMEEVPINAENLNVLKEKYGSQAGEYAGQGAKALGKLYIPSISYVVGKDVAKAHYNSPSATTQSSSGPGGSPSGDNDKLNEDTKETFDWIEKKIQRLDEAIARLDKTVGNTYETWGERNKALGKELDKVAEEMKVHEHAYKRYLENAKNLTVQDVNVAPNEEDSGSNTQYEYDKKQWDEAVKQWKTGKYQKLVQEGKIGQNDIERIQNKYLVETIKQYEELYQKAVQAGDAIQDDQIKLGDLNKTRFDNIQSEFDSILQGFEHVSSLIDERISRSEEHGYFVNQDYYKKQLQLEKDANDRSIQRYNALVKARDKAVDSGAIKLGSQAYVEMTADIHKVREEIEASATAQLQLNNNIRQLKWDVFDYALDRLNLITDEAEFLIDMLDQHELTDDNGYFNERGWASAGLMATEYDVYMQKSKEYAKELTDIEKQFAEEKEKNGVVDKKLIERREELLKLQQDSIKAAEQEKEAIKDLVQNAINKHLEALSKLIDKYKQSLSDAKSLYDYQKNISQQTENITSLQKQLQAYAGDDSEEARATIQKLQKSLEDAEQGLKETEWDKYISETGELLDKMYEDYSETLNDRLDNIDTLMEDMIGWINQKGDLINTTINDVSKQYGYEVSKETQSILNGNGDIVSSFNTDFNNKMAEALDVVKEIKDGIYTIAYGKEAKNIVDSEGTGKISNGKWHKTEDGRWWYENNDGSYAYNETITIDGKKYKFDKNGYLKGYATGSSKIPSNQLAWTQENGSEFILRKSDGAILTPLNAGDMVFTKDMSENLWNLAKNPILTRANTAVPTESITRTISQDNEITIVLPNVQSYDEFKSALQKDAKFANFIQATTLGQSLGKGKLNRGNF